ncbi:MAG: hypothetical protein HN726_01850 [Candidatus Magasanikbacteria bacterium]|jgi:hypothetical protein|nr:hypothetical protein [Candidatus Magasanikbacteria bacterium]MBT4221487.1 hypothetical protein [Candidatus Magasanikbacteria bacterium]MBT4350857.1 hypothetical protein [Candidatus Magasanikbacteria bacterium]MBT4541864.1 hypothetical protein [Candidatus Magasanikbacteria bacterium]MBT6253102.1 hypothetical protein [Candidatus Magasanikbacteria bacterium]
MAFAMMFAHGCVGEDEGSTPDDVTVFETETQQGNDNNHETEQDEDCSNPLAQCEFEEDDGLCGGQSCEDTQQCVDERCECPADQIFKDEETLNCGGASCTLYQDTNTCLWFCCNGIGRDLCLDMSMRRDGRLFWKAESSEQVAPHCHGTMHIE